MNKNLKEKISESVSSVLPITIIVLLLSVTITPMPVGTMVLFLTGAALRIVGMALFSLGTDVSMTPMGEGIGAQLPRTKNLFIVILITFIIGVLITIAEPDLQVLAGQVNKDLVALLKGRGVGLCGMDGQMLRCTELDPQLGHVGEIVHVDATLIASLLDGGFIPVIAPVGMDALGQAYNVNADTAAAQIAIALKAEKLVSMTDIAGLLRDKDDESTLIPEVEVSEIEGYKSAGIIAGGMIPKIGGMADAIYQGVHEAVIIDGRVPHSILLELFSDRGSGTRFYRRSHRE